MEITTTLKDIPVIGDVTTITCGSHTELVAVVNYIITSFKKQPKDDKNIGGQY